MEVELGSRGGTVTQNNELWWNGSKWLSKPEEWPENIRTKTTKESLAEAKKVRELLQLATEQEPDAFSDLIGRKNNGRCSERVHESRGFSITSETKLEGPV